MTPCFGEAYLSPSFRREWAKFATSQAVHGSEPAIQVAANQAGQCASVQSTRSRAPLAPALREQWAQQYKAPPTSTPCPTILQLQ